MSIRKWKNKLGVSYQVRYRDPNGRQVSRNFKTLRDATNFEDEERTKIRKREWIDPQLGDVTFSSWAENWLESDPSKRESTRSRDETIIRLHLNPSFGKYPLNRITPLDVQRVANVWVQKYSPRTVHRHYRTLAAIMSSAVNCDLLIKSPCRAIKLPKFHQKESHIITGKELELLGVELGPFSLMAYMGAMLGMRWGEVAGLRIQDLDLLNKRIQIVQQLSRGKSGRPVISVPKTHTSIRKLAIPISLAEMIAEHIHGMGLNAGNGEALVFQNSVGSALRYSNWRRRVWVPACNRAGLIGLGFHDLRRANATAMVATGVDIKTAQARLGHADPRMTLSIYAQATSEGDTQAANRLEKQFFHPHVDSKWTLRETNSDTLKNTAP